MKILTYDKINPEAGPAYLANGLLGLNIPAIPFFAKQGFLQGYVGISPEDAVEEMLPTPYPLGLDLAINEWWLSDYPHLATFVDQKLAMSCGELTSRLRVEAPDATAEIESVTFCSRTHPMVAIQRTTVSVDKPCELIIRAKIDYRQAMGSLIEQLMPGRADVSRPQGEADAIVHWEAPGAWSSLGMAYLSRLQSPDLKSRTRNDYGHERDMALTNYALAAKPGTEYVMQQLAGMVPSLMHEQPHQQASRMVVHASWHSFEKLRNDNRAAWESLWKGRPMFTGAGDRWQTISDSCFFYTHSSIHASSICGQAAFGLSNRGYKGHVFWDNETFMFPGVLMTNPEAARAEMEFRGRCRTMAEHNARMHGMKGMQFPWQSGNSGSEMTPYYNSAREFHINPAIAFAVGQYLHATGDELFMRETGWPILKGVAEWITSFVTKTDRGYESLHLASPNEKYHDVNNDSQMHLFMKAALRDAIWCAGELGLPAPQKWQEIADDLFMPVDRDTGILLQFEDFPLESDQMASVGPLYHMFPLGVELDEKIAAATREYTRKHIHSYFGMPMSSSYCAVWLARMGERAGAMEALEKGIAARIIDPFMQMVESSPISGRKQPWLTRTTNFLTGQGGFITAAILGFGGLQLRPGQPAESWCAAAPALPEGWESMEVERIFVKGEPARLVVRQGAEKAEIISQEH